MPLNLGSLPQRELHRTLFRFGLFLCTSYLMLASFFHVFGTEWLVAYQTVAFAALGFYGVWTEDRTHLWLYFIVAIFNWFCVSGRLAFMGYITSLAELSTTGCYQYFTYQLPPPSVVESRCVTNGFINWLRLVGLGIILVQGISVYLTYRLYYIDSDSRGEYTTVADGNSGPISSASSNLRPVNRSSAPSSAAPTLTFSSPHQEGYQSSTIGEERFDDNVM